MVDIHLVNQKEATDELLKLFKISYGCEMSNKLWNWKYFENPFVLNDPEIIVAKEKGKIVGARPLLLAEMWIENRIRKVAQPCDMMVHPDYRRHKIFTKMNDYAYLYLKEQHYALFYNFPNSRAYPGNLKQGWQSVAITEDLFVINNPRRVIYAKLNNRPVSAVGGFIYDIIKPKIRKSQSSKYFEIKKSNRFTSEMKQIDSLRDKMAIDLVRSEGFLRWRFDQHPENKYQYILAMENGKLGGYAVVNIQTQANGLRGGLIVDYLVKNNDLNCFRQLIHECMGELKERKCDTISAWSFGQPDLRRELIKYFRFYSSTSFPFSKMLEQSYFVSRQVDEAVLKEVNIYDINNWRINQVYYDIK